MNLNLSCRDRNFHFFYFYFLFHKNSTVCATKFRMCISINTFELISISVFVRVSFIKEIQQAADFLEIPYLSKSIAASIQQTTNQNENIRNYATVSQCRLSSVVWLVV